MYNPGVLGNLNIDELEASTAYSQNLNSCSVAYYGDVLPLFVSKSVKKP